MTSNVKKALMVGGAVVVGYWLWKKYGKGTTVAMPTTSTKVGDAKSFAGEDRFFYNNGYKSFTEMDSILDAAQTDFTGTRPRG